MSKGVCWAIAQKYPHDASNIGHPEEFFWEKINGIYHPVFPPDGRDLPEGVTFVVDKAEDLLLEVAKQMSLRKDKMGEDIKA